VRTRIASLALALAAWCAATISCRSSPTEPTRGDARAPSADAAAPPSAIATRIDAVMQPWANTDTPGCAVAVIHNQKVIHAKGYGMADLERGVPITPDTVFDIASISKQFTATAVLFAAAEGKLALDDDIRTHVPALPQLGETPITIRHLLHHTGGLRDYMTLLVLGGHRYDGTTTVRDAIDALARQRGVAFSPGAKHEYSNTGYVLLAQGVEQATKQTLGAYLDAKVFAPLGMSRTQVDDDHRRIIPGRASAYAPRGDGWEIEMSPWDQTGDGSVMSTVLDLAKWDANFYEPTVGGQPLVDGLLTRGKLADGTELDYAAGLVHGAYRGRPTVWHSGGWAGYVSMFERFPALRTSVVVLCNAGNARPDLAAHRIVDILHDEELQGEPTVDDVPPTTRLAPAELDAWAGTYRHAETGELVTVERVGNELELASAGERYALTPTTISTFRIMTHHVVMRFEGATPHRKLVAKSGDFEEMFTEVELREPTPAELAALAGRYHSDEVDAEWTFTVSDGKLVATGRAFDGPAVVAAGLADEYTITAIGTPIRVTRDKRGRITGFTLTTSVARGVRFDRVPARAR
jgi:CubicO group peptidase (beta-lactamase class C family)